MLTADGCLARRQRLWRALPDDCECVVLARPESLARLAGFWASPFTFRQNEAGAILVLSRDRAVLIGDNLLQPDLDRAFVDEIRAPLWYDGTRPAGDRRQELIAAAQEALGTARSGRIGLDVEGVRSVDGRQGLFPIAEVLLFQRRRKDPDEVSLLRRCLSASDAAFAAALESVRPGMSELEVFHLVSRAATLAAGEPAWVYGDFVASGDGGRRGGPPTPRRIAPGDLLLLDFSVVLQGYRGDCANTFVPGDGLPTSDQQAAFELCLEAIAAGEALLCPGTATARVDATVREVLRGRDALGAFSGHVGHGLGTGHPESPFFVPGSDETLESGDVVTLEPGLYRPGSHAMRFERNYLITANGYEVLSRHRLTISPS